MRISKNQNTSETLDWLVKKAFDENGSKKDFYLTSEKLNRTASHDVNDISLCVECEKIENCANCGETYYFNSTWDESHINHLKEYALACGLTNNKIVGVNPDHMSKPVEKTASTKTMVKMASTVSVKTDLEKSLEQALGDPFRIAERTDMSYMEKAEWQTIEKQANLIDVPKEAMNGGVLPLRGGEDYRISNSPAMPKNQNTISNPNQIESLYTSQEEDNGVRLAREIAQKKEAREAYNKNWEMEKIQDMQDNGFEAKGVVFPTEVLNACSGISHSTMSAYSKFDFSDLPEKTDGEQLRDVNIERKASIQRERSQDRSWEELKASPSLMISDAFTEQLKKGFKK